MLTEGFYEPCHLYTVVLRVYQKLMNMLQRSMFIHFSSFHSEHSLFMCHTTSKILTTEHIILRIYQPKHLKMLVWQPSYSAKVLKSILSFASLINDYVCRTVNWSPDAPTNCTKYGSAIFFIYRLQYRSYWS
jgi:hypothetical protein